MKTKIIKYFDDLTFDIQNLIKLNYPFGGNDFMVSFKKPNGSEVRGLPFETSEAYYIVIMQKPVVRKKKMNFRFTPPSKEILDLDDDHI